MKLLALVLLLSAFSSLTLTEVVKDFEKSKCSKFFIQSPNMKKIIPPTVFEGKDYKKICQHWKTQYRFATLYDTRRRIPVYSAYTFSGEHQHVRNEEWKNEPQLENINNTADIELIPREKMDEFIHQAVNRDYEESNRRTNIEYTRGHVFPHQYAGNQDQADSTFTFTNIAPQTQHSNGEWERHVETPMRGVITRNCNPTYENPAYVVTGVVPGDKWIPITRKENNILIPVNEGVNIPSYYWTAFCCFNNNNQRISKAYLVLQNKEDGIYEISQMSVNRLNIQLTRLYNQDFIIFGQLCLTYPLNNLR